MRPSCLWGSKNHKNYHLLAIQGIWRCLFIILIFFQPCSKIIVWKSQGRCWISFKWDPVHFLVVFSMARAPCWSSATMKCFDATGMISTWTRGDLACGGTLWARENNRLRVLLLSPDVTMLWLWSKVWGLSFKIQMRGTLTGHNSQHDNFGPCDHKQLA